MADLVIRLSADDMETLIHLVAIIQLPDISSAKIEVQQSLSTQVSEILNARIRIRGRRVGREEFGRALQVAKTAMEIEVLKVKYKLEVEQLFDLRPRLRGAIETANGNARTETIEREIGTATGQGRVPQADNEADGGTNPKASKNGSELFVWFGAKTRANIDMKFIGSTHGHAWPEEIAVTGWLAEDATILDS